MMDEHAPTSAVTDDELASDGDYAVETSPVEQPPLRWRLAYRMLDRRLPQQYGRWLLADLHRPGWAARTTFTRYFHMLVELAALLVVLRFTWGKWWMPLEVGMVALLAMAPYDYVRARRRPVTVRAEVLARQGIDASGDPLVLEAPIGLERFAAPFRRITAARDANALLYVVSLVVLLGGTAVIGLNLADNEPASAGSPPKSTRKCLTVPKDVEQAIMATFKDKQVKFGDARATRFGKGMAVAAYLDNPGATDPTKKLAFGGWVVDGAAASSYTVRQVDFGDKSDISTAPKVQMSEIGSDNKPTERVSAFTDAIRCLGEMKQKERK